LKRPAFRGPLGRLLRAHSRVLRTRPRRHTFRQLFFSRTKIRMLTSRRTFITAAAAGAAGVAGAAVGLPVGLQAALAPARRSHGSRSETIRLGVASYSLRNFPRARAIEMVQALRTPYINLKSFHMPYELTAEERSAARTEIEVAGLKIVGGGTITFEEDTDAEVRKYFEYAKGAGMPLMVVTGAPEILPRIERFAQQYDIRIAIHNHGPEDKFYPSPYDALKHIRSMDRRMGLCIDIGHTVRTGVDVVQSIADAGARLLDMHAKDLRDLTDKGSQCIVGEGAIPFPDIFRQLQKMAYGGYVNLEYEIDADDPLPGMKQSFAYMRGVLAGLAATGIRTTGE
jgi:sugar phosphate isomerase/epimerase